MYVSVFYLAQIVQERHGYDEGVMVLADIMPNGNTPLLTLQRGTVTSHRLCREIVYIRF